VRSEQPFLAPVCVASLVAFALATYVVDVANRELRRMFNNAASPIISSAGEMRSGAALVRAMRVSRFFVGRLTAAIDDWYMATACQGLRGIARD
jgi:hypothetical protein